MSKTVLKQFLKSPEISNKTLYAAAKNNIKIFQTNTSGYHCYKEREEVSLLFGKKPQQTNQEKSLE